MSFVLCWATAGRVNRRNMITHAMTAWRFAEDGVWQNELPLMTLWLPASSLAQATVSKSGADVFCNHLWLKHQLSNCSKCPSHEENISARHRRTVRYWTLFIRSLAHTTHLLPRPILPNRCWIPLE